MAFRNLAGRGARTPDGNKKTVNERNALLVRHHGGVQRGRPSIVARQTNTRRRSVRPKFSPGRAREYRHRQLDDDNLRTLSPENTLKSRADRSRQHRPMRPDDAHKRWGGSTVIID